MPDQANLITSIIKLWGYQGKVQERALKEPNGYHKTCHTLNPALLLLKETQPLKHDCTETIDTVYSSCPDLGGEPLLNAEEDWCTDRSCFMREGKKLVRYAVTSQT